jgi:hypothetical protein
MARRANIIIKIITYDKHQFASRRVNIYAKFAITDKKYRYI